MSERQTVNPPPVGQPYIPPTKDGQPSGSFPGAGPQAYPRRGRARGPDQWVGIDQATGLFYGPDGFFHPGEVDNEGNIQVTSKAILEALEGIRRELRMLRMGMVAAENSVCDEIEIEAVTDESDE